MDTVEFIEQVLNIMLFDYQKRMIRYLDEHPDYQIRFPRERSIPSWFQIYLLTKSGIKNYFYKEEYQGYENSSRMYCVD